MTKSDMIIIDGHPSSWQHFLELRRQQVEARRAAQRRRLALFELKHDCRPQTDAQPADRYQEPAPPLHHDDRCGKR